MLVDNERDESFEREVIGSSIASDERDIGRDVSTEAKLIKL